MQQKLLYQSRQCRREKKRLAKANSLLNGLVGDGTKLTFKHRMQMAIEREFNKTSRLSMAKRAKILAQVCWNVLDCACQPFLVDFAKSWLRSNVFTPWKLLKQMDLAGGVLNYGGIELLRKLETGGKKHVRTMLPSSTVLQNTAQKLENLGSQLCPYEVFDGEDGKAQRISFDPAAATNLILKAYKLDGLAAAGLQDENCRPQVSGTLDGFALTRSKGIVMAGIKITDARACVPLGQRGLLFGTDPSVTIELEGNEELLVTKLNSRRQCFPTDLLMGKENVEMYNLLEGFFHYLREGTI